jgi:nitrous oxide reductase accessory protein NosL
MSIERWLVLLFVGLLGACSGDPDSGPKSVKWDRDSCERCRMVVSDRSYAAQVRYRPQGSPRSKVLYFDDIGCAVLWLEDKPWKDQADTELWVIDYRSGEWIDARKAFYLPGRKTPMDYGLAAQVEAIDGALDFKQTKAHVWVVEERINAHIKELLAREKEMARKRLEDSDEKPLPSIKPGT